jgi:hypothetical protein
MKTGVLSLAVLLLVGCVSTQTSRFAGHTPGLEGSVAEWVWASQLNRKTTARWHHNFASVRAVRGSVTVETDDSIKAARVGRQLRAGAKITAAENSGADLYLAANGPVLRMTEGSKIRLVRLDLWKDENGAEVIDTMIEVEDGRVLGYVKPLSSDSSYLLKTRGGVIRIRGTEFAVNADGTCKVLRGVAEVFGDSETTLVRAGEKFVPEKGVAKVTPKEMQEGQDYLVASSN